MKQEIQNLIFRTIDGTASQEEFDRLQAAMEQDSEVVAEYVACVNMCFSLTEIAHFEDPSSICEPSTTIDALAAAPRSGRPGNLGSRAQWMLALLILVATGLSWIAMRSLSIPLDAPVAIVAPVAEESKPAAPQLLESETEVPLYVAQFVGITQDVVWNKRSATPDFLLRARKGDRYEIEEGLVEIEYFTGARLIFHGPCEFVITGAKTARLIQGQVTGNVDGGDFLLTTPSATVLDLGTEFGVVVNENADTEVCVFDGEVEVGSESTSAGEGLSLTSGMSARVDRGGIFGRVENFDTSQFARTLPKIISQAAGEISLVDLLSATSSQRFRLAGVIAPDSGRPDQQPWLKSNGPGHRPENGFRLTSWHPFVDGVFIPPADGLNVRLNSIGQQVLLPRCSGRSWGPIWSRRKIDGDASIDTYEDFWGTQTLKGVVKRLKRAETGMIGIHSNVGITFDLQAVRQLWRAPTEFRSTISNLDNSGTKGRPRHHWVKNRRLSADIRVFVDGELKASRENLTRADGDEELKIALTKQDRFLTIVSSDFDGFDGFDHVVLIDPVLHLEHVDTALPEAAKR